uniref:Uncharacterized protein n=1 Tax=viral metagenome TaxID=1070528 RepID=A0A2V0R9L2_9ZZZZ
MKMGQGFEPNVIVMPMGFGKTTLARTFPEAFIDVDDIYKASESFDAKGKALRREALKTGDWTEVNQIHSDRLREYYTTGPGAEAPHRMLLMHSAPDHAFKGLDAAFLANKIYYADQIPQSDVLARVWARIPKDQPSDEKTQTMELAATNYSDFEARKRHYEEFKVSHLVEYAHNLLRAHEESDDWATFLMKVQSGSFN